MRARCLALNLQWHWSKDGPLFGSSSHDASLLPSTMRIFRFQLTEAIEISASHVNYLLLHRFRFRQIHDPLADFTCDGWLEYDIVQSDTI